MRTEKEIAKFIRSVRNRYFLALLFPFTRTFEFESGFCRYVKYKANDELRFEINDFIIKYSNIQTLDYLLFIPGKLYPRCRFFNMLLRNYRKGIIPKTKKVREDIQMLIGRNNTNPKIYFE